MSDTNQAAVAVIINDEGDVLTVTNRRYKSIALPGGKVEMDETPLVACAREVQEEVGLLVQADALTSLGSATSDTGRLVHVFHVAEYSGTPLAVEEGTEVHWVDFRYLVERSVFRGFYNRVFPNGLRHLREANGR